MVTCVLGMLYNVKGDASEKKKKKNKGPGLPRVVTPVTWQISRLWLVSPVVY
jgi:hypothetical protein